MAINIGDPVKSLTRSDLKSEFRNLKLKIIKGDYEFKFSESKTNMLRNELDFISKKLLPTDVITGSIALKLYGLLDRNYSDIDIIIEDKSRYDNYSRNVRYGSLDDTDLDTRLGHKQLSYKKGFFSRKKKYAVDFFENSGVSYNELEFNGYKFRVHSPMELIDTKIGLCEDQKHFEDIDFIFKSIELSD
jgi:hypothetical protein